MLTTIPMKIVTKTNVPTKLVQPVNMGRLKPERFYNEGNLNEVSEQVGRWDHVQYRENVFQHFKAKLICCGTFFVLAIILITILVVFAPVYNTVHVVLKGTEGWWDVTDKPTKEELGLKHPWGPQPPSQ